MLTIQADQKIQVGTKDADLLEAAVQQAKRLDLTGGLHMLKLSVPDDPRASCRFTELPLSPLLLSSIASFQRENLYYGIGLVTLNWFRTAGMSVVGLIR